MSDSVRRREPVSQPTRRQIVRVVLAVTAAGALGLGAVGLAYGDVWHAGWPMSVEVLEGRWVLDEMRGDFAREPPQWLEFTTAPDEHLGDMHVEGRSHRFELHAVGQLVFDQGTALEPLVSTGEQSVFTGTHLCAPFREWDQLAFYPDGMPLGENPDRRMIRYEREDP